MVTLKGANGNEDEVWPPTQHEVGRDKEEDRKRVESEIRLTHLARHRLAELDGTLWSGISQLIGDVLQAYEEVLRHGYSEEFGGTPYSEATDDLGKGFPDQLGCPCNRYYGC